MAVVDITSENFEELVLQNAKPVVLDFWAIWCGPCSMMSPVVDAASEQHPELVFGKIDTDAQPELAAQFGITAIPTLVIMKGGAIAASTQGYRDAAAFEQFLAQAVE